MKDLARFNQLAYPEAVAELLRCCHSRTWARAVAGARPFRDFEELARAAENAADGLGREDWLEAFRGHPKIGDRASLAKKFASTAEWAAGEQAGTQGADAKVLDELEAGNAQYEREYGFIFIVCATGKSAAEMLAILKSRLGRKPEEEVLTASLEQRKITRIRLEKLI